MITLNDKNNMKQEETYEIPKVEVIEVNVEKGFAASVEGEDIPIS